MRNALLVLLVLACRPHEDDTGDTSDTSDTSDSDTADTSDTGDTDDTAVCPDADDDGYCDAIDTCDGPGADDADGDGTCDDADACFGTGNDTDGDGVCDGIDDCTGDDASGDLDGDGTCDDLDVCYGVGVDTDSDGLCDDVDLCSGDNTTGDDDSDGVCDGSDACVGPAWCWNLTFTIGADPTGTAFDNLVGQTLSYSLGVGDDDLWDYSAGSSITSNPEVLSKSGSNPAAQTLIDSLAAPRITMLGNGSTQVRMDASPGCVNGETHLTFQSTGTGWTFNPVDETVNLSATTPSTSAELEKIGTCTAVSDEATGVATLITIDGNGAP